jgi:hypothetical protein
MKVDPLSLVTGVVTVAIGLVVLLDSSGALEVSPGWVAVVLTGAAGAVLLVSGLLDAGERERHD